MKYIHLASEVNEEMSNTVTNVLNEEGEVTFYLNSNGGRAQFARFIVDVINKNKDRVTLIATHEISSAAFRIFFQSKCKREILDDTEGLAHMGRLDVKMDGNQDINSVDKWRLKEMKKEEHIQEKFLLSLGVSKKNRKLFLKGYDIYFATEKLRKMLKKSESI